MGSKRTFVTTDTHGELEKLKSCLEQANFDNDVDELIHLGDCVDRGPDSYGVVELLLSIKNLISIRGNHDDWMMEFINTKLHPAQSYFMETLASYRRNQKEKGTEELIPQSHIDFLRNQINYYVDGRNRLFLHAGYDPNEHIEEQDEVEFYWDRNLIKKVSKMTPDERYPDVNSFKQVFIGHTPTLNFRWHEHKDKPMYLARVVDCDTGGCFGGKISLIDITTDEHILYQSE